MASTIEGKMPHGQGLSLYSQSGLLKAKDIFLMQRNKETCRMRPVSGAAQGFSKRS
jgi:hypothetical protein